RGARRRRLRRALQRRDGRAAAHAAETRRALQGHGLHARHRARARRGARVWRPHRHRGRSERSFDAGSGLAPAVVTRILIVRLGSLGDLVHALPAVAAIRRAHPAAEIDWLVDVIHRDFLDLVPVITRSVALEGRGMTDWRRAIRALRAEK